MARPLAGESPPKYPAAPLPTVASGLSAPAAVFSPFNYTNQPVLPGAGVRPTPTPASLFNAFRRRWILGTLIGIIAAGTAVLAIWFLLPTGKHEARAIVQLRARGNELGLKNSEEFAEYRQRQLFLLKTRDLITRTLADPSVSSLDMIKNSSDPVAMLEEQLRVRPVTDDIILITLTGNNLEEMKVVLDQLVKRYVDETSAYDRKDLDDQTRNLEQKAEELRVEIEAKEREIELLGRANSTTGGEDNAPRLALLNQRHVETDTEYNRVGRMVIGLKSELKVLQQQLADKNPTTPPDPLLVNEAIKSDPVVAKAERAWRMETTLLKNELKIAEGNDDQPYIVELKAKVAKLEKEYLEAQKDASEHAVERARVIERSSMMVRASQLETQIRVKEEERERLKEERDAYKKLIDQGVGGGLNIQAMRDSLKPQKEMYVRANAILTNLRFEAKHGSKVSMRGDVDKVPNLNQNKKIIFSTAGGLMTFFVVVLVVAYLEWRTRRIDGVDQVVTELGMRVIGTVPTFPNRANMQSAVEAGAANWRFVLNESINSTRTMLLHTARTQSMQVVMVTSATQGEGKTSLASQLASSMATAGMRTLLVDCDLRNPSLQKLFDLPLGPGVSDVLRQEIDANEVVQATTVPNLWVITAGQCSNATIAALAQGHPLDSLFNLLRGRFDFVIVDSCPVLPVADALLIAQHVDGVLFSLMQDVSQLPKVMTASEKLQHLNIPLVGAVINGIKQDVYSYGYNYVKQLPA